MKLLTMREGVFVYSHKFWRNYNKGKSDYRTWFFVFENIACIWKNNNNPTQLLQLRIDELVIEHAQLCQSTFRFLFWLTFNQSKRKQISQRWPSQSTIPITVCSIFDVILIYFFKYKIIGWSKFLFHLYLRIICRKKFHKELNERRLYTWDEINETNRITEQETTSYEFIIIFCTSINEKRNQLFNQIWLEKKRKTKEKRNRRYDHWFIAEIK
jgi:hypothetical protein